jgi:hypothetical protein
VPTANAASAGRMILRVFTFGYLGAGDLAV